LEVVVDTYTSSVGMAGRPFTAGRPFNQTILFFRLFPPQQWNPMIAMYARLNVKIQPGMSNGEQYVTRLLQWKLTLDDKRRKCTKEVAVS
jgi:hypothetical protein